MLGWQVLLGVDLAARWIFTGENVADDPSRDVPFRPLRIPVPPEAARLIRPRSTNTRWRDRRGGAIHLSCIDVFAGCGRLDAYPSRGAYRAEQDILKDVLFLVFGLKLKQDVSTMSMVESQHNMVLYATVEL